MSNSKARHSKRVSPAKLDQMVRSNAIAKALKPVSLADSTGATHEFHFRTHFLHAGVVLDAFELRDGYPSGYQFQIIGRRNEDLLALMGRLLERMRRCLSIKHLRNDEDGIIQIGDDRVVRGKIEWDDSLSGAAPLLTVDGREITWQEFGSTLMSFEGWQFKLDLRDMSEDI